MPLVSSYQTHTHTHPFLSFFPLSLSLFLSFSLFFSPSLSLSLTLANVPKSPVLQGLETQTTFLVDVLMSMIYVALDA